MRLLLPTRHASQASHAASVAFRRFSSSVAALPSRMIGRSTQAHYPERNGGVFIINAPSAFPMVWRGVSAFFAKRVKDKISPRFFFL